MNPDELYEFEDMSLDPTELEKAREVFIKDFEIEQRRDREDRVR